MRDVCIVRGFKTIDYVSKKDNQRKQGYELYLELEKAEKNVTGDQFLIVYISCSKCDYIPALDDEVEILYNKYGSVEKVVPAE